MVVSPTETQFKRFTAPRIELILRADYADSLMKLDLTNPDAWLADRSHQVMRGRGPLISLELPDRPGERVVIRHYHHGGLLRKITRDLFIGKNRFIRELELTSEAFDLGVPTLDVLGLVIRTVVPGIYRADLITRQIPDTMDLQQYFCLFPRPDRHQVIAAAAGALRSLHDAGILHADLNLKNILVSVGDGDRPQVFVIDLDKSKRLGKLNLGERLWNLARINRSAQKLNRRRLVVSGADRLRFYRSYAEGLEQMAETFDSRLFDLTLHQRWWKLVETLRGRDLHGLAAAQRILVKGPNWLGDAVMTLPALRALRRGCPRAEICLVTQAGLADLYESLPEVDRVMSYESEADLLKMAPVLRRWPIDAAVIFPRSVRSSLFAFLCRIPIRVGYQSGWRGPLLTTRVERDRSILSTHRVHYYSHLIRSLGLRVEEEEPRGLFPDAGTQAKAETLLAEPVGSGPWIALHAGATYGGAKQWFPDRFAQLGRLLVEKNRARIAVLGAGAAEVELAKKIVTEIGEGAISLAGRTSITELTAVLERCDLMITNDTGPMHLAAAVGTPVVAIFGPTDPVTTAPYGSDSYHQVVCEPVTCSPCLKRECPIDHRCMTRIDVSRVYAAAVDRLAARPPRTGSNAGPAHGATA